MPEALRGTRKPAAPVGGVDSLPRDLGAEEAVLGAILQGGDEALVLVADRLRPSDFFREHHGRVFGAALALLAAGVAVDPTTIAGELERSKTLDLIGGRARLAMMEQAVPTWRNAPHYAAAVKDRSRARRLHMAASEILARLGEGAPVDEVSEAAQEAVFAAAVDVAKAPSALIDLLRRRLSRLDEQMESGHAAVGLPTGFTDIDNAMGGLEPGDLVVVGGRPGMGKTSWVLQVALNVALAGSGVLFFSLEMSDDQLTERLLSMQSRVDGTRIHRGTLSAPEYERIVHAMGPLERAPMRINDQPNLNAVEMLAAARREMPKQRFALVVIDYLQLMSSVETRRDASRTEDVSATSRALKSMARELGVPVVVISQLSREVEKREDKRPRLSDLRDSGQIEADADVALLFHRPEAYDAKAKPVANIDIAKQRRGPTGVVQLLFKKSLTRFENLSKEDA